jgi:hypothetical protein
LAALEPRIHPRSNWADADDRWTRTTAAPWLDNQSARPTAR